LEGSIISLGVLELLFVSFLKYFFLRRQAADHNNPKVKFLYNGYTIIQCICLAGMLLGVILTTFTIDLRPFMVVIISFIIYVLPMLIVHFYYKNKVKNG
jgi:L-asparagine transporter-like permease